MMHSRLMYIQQSNYFLRVNVSLAGKCTSTKPLEKRENPPNPSLEHQDLKQLKVSVLIILLPGPHSSGAFCAVQFANFVPSAKQLKMFECLKS